MSNSNAAFSALIHTAAMTLEINLSDSGISYLAEESDRYLKDFVNQVSVVCLTSRSQMISKQHFERVLKSRGEFIDKSTGYIPESGDIIFFTDNNGITSYHTGIVTSCDGSRVYTVEGNTGYSEGATNWSNSWVATTSYSINSSLIYGYFSINK